MVMLSSQYPEIKIPIETRKELTEMKHKPNDASPMARFLLKTLFKRSEIEKNSYKELTNDGTKRIELILSN